MQYFFKRVTFEVAMHYQQEYTEATMVWQTPCQQPLSSYDAWQYQACAPIQESTMATNPKDDCAFQADFWTYSESNTVWQNHNTMADSDLLSDLHENLHMVSDSTTEASVQAIMESQDFETDASNVVLNEMDGLKDQVEDDIMNCSPLHNLSFQLAVELLDTAMFGPELPHEMKEITEIIDLEPSEPYELTWLETKAPTNIEPLAKEVVTVTNEQENINSFDVEPSVPHKIEWLESNAPNKIKPAADSEEESLLPRQVNGMFVCPCKQGKIVLGDSNQGLADCGKSFKRRADCMIHIRTHTGEKPYKCNKCDKRFVDSSNLKKHQKIHSTIKRYECKVCGNKFAQASTLTAHERIHTGQKPYACKICGKTFIQSSNRIAHERTHKNQNVRAIESEEIKPFECEICGKAFGYSSNLWRHKRSHDGQKPHECDVCGKTFGQFSNMLRHKRIHE